MLIATIKDEFGFDRQQDEAKSSSKFEEMIREAGVVGSDIHCRMHEGRLLIHGQVASYCQKQLAQEAVRDFPGVIEISNQLQVGCSVQQTLIAP